MFYGRGALLCIMGRSALIATSVPADDVISRHGPDVTGQRIQTALRRKTGYIFEFGALCGPIGRSQEHAANRRACLGKGFSESCGTYMA